MKIIERFESGKIYFKKRMLIFGPGIYGDKLLELYNGIEPNNKRYKLFKYLKNKSIISDSWDVVFPEMLVIGFEETPLKGTFIPELLENETRTVERVLALDSAAIANFLDTNSAVAEYGLYTDNHLGKKSLIFTPQISQTFPENMFDNPITEFIKITSKNIQKFNYSYTIKWNNISYGEYSKTKKDISILNNDLFAKHLDEKSVTWNDIHLKPYYEFNFLNGESIDRLKKIAFEKRWNSKSNPIDFSKTMFSLPVDDDKGVRFDLKYKHMLYLVKLYFYQNGTTNLYNPDKEKEPERWDEERIKFLDKFFEWVEGKLKISKVEFDYFVTFEREKFRKDVIFSMCIADLLFNKEIFAKKSQNGKVITFEAEWIGTRIKLPRKHKIRTFFSYNFPFGESQRENDLITLSKIYSSYKPSKHSYGYIPERALGGAISLHVLSQNYLKLDISNFFETIDHQILKNKVKEIGINPRLIRTTLMKNKGVMQGRVLSPILSDIYLNDFDKKTEEYCEKNDIKYSRYVDDIMFSSENKMNFDEIINFVNSQFEALKISLNHQKQKIIKNRNENLKFLGVVFKNKNGEWICSFSNRKQRHIQDLIKNAFINPSLRKLQRIGGYVNIVDEIEKNGIDFNEPRFWYEGEKSSFRDVYRELKKQWVNLT